MSWLRLDADYVLDGKLRRAKARAVWPWFLALLKRSGGSTSIDEVDAEIAAQDLDLPADIVAAQLDGLRRVGLLVEAEGEVTTPRWSDFQPDPTASARQRAFRERNRKAKAAAEAESGGPAVTASNGDMPLRDVTSPLVTPDRTGHDVHTPPLTPPSGGYASEGEPSIPDLESLALECKPASKRRGSCLTTPEARKLVELADKYGPTAVRDALLEAGGAEMPVAFAAKVLRSRPAERRDEDWDKIGDQRQAERAALRAMTPEQRAERFAPAVAAFARLAKGG